MVTEINLSSPIEKIKTELLEKKIEVGMVEFTLKKDFLPIPNEFEKIGNFELDILAIEKNSGIVVMLDHDKPDFIMGKVASDLKAMVSALIPIEGFFEMASENDELYDDESAMRKVTSKSANLSGGKEFEWFYDMIFGI
ncbi:hypothetical protein [Lacinutrix himadriensis]|uniref:hypothetical protein n=1 Tax=Lacinutrix himadriensis TaxID=641549 RepID=UPI0006E2A310|nr:hypothetical protein [Lacinutrix himadriensis]